MLVLNENSYITLDEANSIMNELLSTSDAVILWNSLSESDKESIIINATEQYDNDEMHYIGEKVSEDQPLQFPRKIGNKEISCPYKIKKGILLQGIRSVEINNSEEEKLRENGVVSFSDGSGAKIEFSEGYISKYRTTGIYKDIWNNYFRSFSEIGKYFSF